MSMKWIEPDLPQFEYGEAPSVWISVVIAICIFIVCFIATVLNWKQGKPIVSAEFFVRILLLPALVSGAVSSLLYIRHEDWIDRVNLWNNRCKWIYANWRWWAQERVAIIRSVTLTPEKDLGVRMLGLEGSAPSNAGKTLALTTDTKEGSMSRVQQVLEQLVMPFAPYMTGYAGHNTFSIILQSGREEDLNDLRALLRKLVPRDFGLLKIKHVTEPIGMGMIESWLTKNNVPDYCLVLAYQLHTTGIEPTYTEAAVSTLIASSAVVSKSRGKLRPDAWIFRPATAAMDRIFETLKTMLAAKQTPNERIKHLWLTHVPGQGKHATLTAVNDVDLKVAAHDLDTAIGLPGPVNAMLVQALAATMVQHGQGTQLIATPHNAGVMLNLLGTSISPVEDVKLEPPLLTSISFTCLVTCVTALLMLMFTDAGASYGWFVGAVAGFLVMLIVAAVFALVRADQVAKDFRDALPW